MLTAMCSLAFFAFLHVGDITVNGRDYPNLSRLPQLEHLVNEKGQVTALQLSILKYKHTCSTNGHPFTIFIYKEDSCCPVQAILDFVSHEDCSIVLFFAGQTGRPSPDPYKSHSFRIGAASWAAAKCFSDTDSPVRPMEILCVFKVSPCT